MSVSIALFCEAQSINEEEQRKRIVHYLESYYQQLKRFNKKKDDPFTLKFTKDEYKGSCSEGIKKASQNDNLIIC